MAFDVRKTWLKKKVLDLLSVQSAQWEAFLSRVSCLEHRKRLAALVSEKEEAPGKFAPAETAVPSERGGGWTHSIFSDSALSAIREAR